MSKYRIIEEIDNTLLERETRKHIEREPIVNFYIEEKVYDRVFGIFWEWHRKETHDTLESAKRSIEELTGKYITTKVHEVIIDE